MKLTDDTTAGEFQMWLQEEHLHLRLTTAEQREPDGKTRCTSCGETLQSGAMVVVLTAARDMRRFAGNGRTFMAAASAAVSEYERWKETRPVREDESDDEEDKPAY